MVSTPCRLPVRNNCPAAAGLAIDVPFKSSNVPSIPSEVIDTPGALKLVGMPKFENSALLLYMSCAAIV